MPNTRSVQLAKSGKSDPQDSRICQPKKERRRRGVSRLRVMFVMYVSGASKQELLDALAGVKSDFYRECEEMLIRIWRTPQSAPRR